MSQKNLFTTEDLALEFILGDQTVKAVQKCNITIPENEITIIYGASGSGKSSLLNIISGLQAPTTGSIFYGSSNLYGLTVNELAFFRAHELGIVYQTNYWVKSLSVLENIAMPLYFLGYTKTDARAKSRQALERVNMSDYANKYPQLLSGGEQQRIAMARAIVSDPPVIIADEPTGNLDSKNGDMIIGLLKELNQAQGKTVVLVTHNMEYLSIAKHLLEIQDGKVTEILKTDIPKTIDAMLADAQKRIKTLMAEPANE